MPEGDRMSTRGPVDDLFSTVATDNAEVVPPVGPQGPDRLWSTGARPAGPTGPADAPEGVVVEDPVDGEVVDDTTEHSTWGSTSESPGQDPHATPPPFGRSGGTPPRFGGVFTAEPVERDVDVVDAEEPAIPEPPPFHGERPSAAPPSTATGQPLFSSMRGAEPSSAPASDRHDPWTSTGQGFAPDEATVRRDRPTADSRGDSSGGAWIDGHHRVDEGIPDPNGLRAAIARLSPLDVERCAVPIAVCGALLREGEQVLGAVTGQMLGRPAVIVVSEVRVLVVNDRRWQPLVDEFEIGESLVVRGRHDRNVAALSFSDPTRLSMVDGITEVGLAIELADRIRDAGAP